MTCCRLTRHSSGAYSRFGWNHPGPLPFQLLALPLAVLGGDADALRLATVLLNTLGLIAVAALASRRGIAGLVAVLGAITALVAQTAPHTLSDGWNVTIALVPFLLTIVACWCALCHDGWAAAVAAVAFSFVVQSHIGFGVVLAPLATVTAVALVVAARRGDGGPHPWRELRRGTVARRHHRRARGDRHPARLAGQHRAPLDWTLSNGEPKVGAAQAVRAIGRATSASYPFHPEFDIFFLEIDHVDTGVLPGLLLVVLAAATVLAWRRPMPSERALCTCLCIVWASAVVGVASIARPFAPWLIEWLQPLVWLTWSAVALVAWRLVQHRVGARAVTPLAALGAVVLVIATVGTIRSAASTPFPTASSRTILRTLAEGAEPVLADGELWIEAAGDPFAAGTMMLGLVNDLDRRGADVCVDPDLAYQFGSARTCPSRTDPYLVLTQATSPQPPPAGGELLAVADGPSPGEQFALYLVSDPAG